MKSIKGSGNWICAEVTPKRDADRVKPSAYGGWKRVRLDLAPSLRLTTPGANVVPGESRWILSMRFLTIAVFVGTLVGGVTTSVVQAQESPVLVEDFESYEPGAAPPRWKYIARTGQRFLPLEGLMDENERFYVVREGGRKFLRGYTKAEAQRISLANFVHGLEWELSTHPSLSWEWRALKLPASAREDRLNDTGAAVYVSFDKKDWLGRPYSIKYTYSSTLPRGTVVETGPVKVIVVSSGKDGHGDWIRVERDVEADYRRLFGAAPPDRPYSITLWSDSDDTRDEGEADFDNIRLLP